MKVKKSDHNALYIVLCCILSIIITLAGIRMLAASFVEVNSPNGTYTTYLNYNDRLRTPFEDSISFQEPFRNAINDITRLCVIRNQMETGGNYDANKRIDITKYACRRDAIKDNGPTAVYKLDDLIKWGNYGYDYQAITGTEAQLDAYFYALQNNGNEQAVTSTVHIDNGSVETEEDVLYILVDRYKTVEGKSLIEYAANRAQYEALVKNLCASADSLFENYTDYAELNEKYSSANTNLLYCYQFDDVNGKSVRYHNMKRGVETMSNDELSKTFTELTKYVCFNPDKLQLATNSKFVDAVLMKKALSGYEYAFADGSRIWIGLDGTYPVKDVFSESKALYGRIDSLYIPAGIALVSASILFIALLILMTIQAGKVTVTYEDGTKESVIRAGKWDSMAMEFYLLVVAIVVVLLGGMLGFTFSFIFEDGVMPILYDDITYIIMAVEAVIITFFGLNLYLILVRKIKCKLIWKGSITRWILYKLKVGILDVYDNGQLMARTWLPFLLFLAFNLVMVLLGIKGIVIAFVLDMLVGAWFYHETKVREDIVEGITTISDGDITHQIDVTGMHGDNLALASAVNNIGDGIRVAVETSMKDEKMKADLITNVSHDIKTPLTSIINFVDLLKRENIEDERIRGYIEVLDQKSQRLKALTNDLVEASKISSGNITLNIERINMRELINQSIAEFEEKFEEKGLIPVLTLPEEPVYVMADSRGIYRVIENLYNNIYKYALEGTRVYVDMTANDGKVAVVFKNISAEPLNVDSKDLTERFIRGDVSRKTEGSGLGLSIAKSLTEAQKGTFEINLDGDLFKAIVLFDIA